MSEKKNKHTSGPWCIESDGWITSPHSVVCEYEGCGTHNAFWLNPADIALVEAAPELLEALLILNPRQAVWRTPTDAEAAVIEAAIAKARGES